MMDCVIDENISTVCIGSALKASSCKFSIICHHHDELIQLIEFETARACKDVSASVPLKDGVLIIKKSRKLISSTAFQDHKEM
jgi:hypothetical protein